MNSPQIKLQAHESVHGVLNLLFIQGDQEKIVGQCIYLSFPYTITKDGLPISFLAHFVPTNDLIFFHSADHAQAFLVNRWYLYVSQSQNT